jgi:hypothetical protein
VLSGRSLVRQVFDEKPASIGQPRRDVSDSASRAAISVSFGGTRFSRREAGVAEHPASVAESMDFVPSLPDGLCDASIITRNDDRLRFQVCGCSLR